MSAAFTPGPLEVRMNGTMTGVWAEIGQVCQDPETGEEWFRDLARTETTHIRRDKAYPQHGAKSFLPFEDAPEQFRKDDNCDEHLANARLWAAAPELYAVIDEWLSVGNSLKARKAIRDRARAALSRVDRGEQ